MNRNTGAKASATVTVACKYPGGLILRRHVMRAKTELVMGGGTREVTEAIPTGERFVVNGPSREPGKMPFQRSQSGAAIKGTQVDVTSGFALTPNVPKDLWDSWLEANKDSAMVRNGLIFASSQATSVKAQARDHEKQRSGLEPIDPNRPGRGIEIADEMKGRAKAA